MQISDQQVERIAKLTLQGVCDEDVADIMQLTTEQLNEIRDHEVYRDKAAGMLNDKLDTFDTINDGLDAIETLTIAQLLAYLGSGVDPDFALKALAVVNRATRKGHVSNKPLDVPTGGRTTIDLNANFVVALQKGADIGMRVIEQVEQKAVDALPIERVEKLLAREEPLMEQLLATGGD